MNELKSIECDPNCGFMIRSHDEGEVINVAKKHSKDKHDKNVSDKEMKNSIKTLS